MTSTTFSGCEIGKSYRGRVIDYFEGKGYGFVRPDGADTDRHDVFVHFSEIREWNKEKWKRAKLDLNDPVEFDVVPGNGKQLKAANVRVCA